MITSKDIERFDDTIPGMSFISYLQMLAWDNSTSTLLVCSAGVEGRIYYHQGEIIDAETPTSRGLDAVYAICNWPAPEVELLPPGVRVRSINVPPTHIVLEAAQRQDEEIHGAGFSLAREETNYVLAPLPLDDSTVLRKILNTYPEIDYCAFLRGNGEIIAQSASHFRFQTILRFTLLTGYGMAKIFNNEGPECIEMPLAKGRLLLVIPDAEKSVALCLHNPVLPVGLVEQIKEIVGNP